MKMSVAGTAFAVSPAVADSPTTSPRYAGTSGTTHGARNDATPAPNNATRSASTASRAAEGEREELRPCGLRAQAQRVLAGRAMRDDAEQIRRADRDHRAALAVHGHAWRPRGLGDGSTVELHHHRGGGTGRAGARS